jgi:hypothetical protein
MREGIKKKTPCDIKGETLYFHKKQGSIFVFKNEEGKQIRKTRVILQEEAPHLLKEDREEVSVIEPQKLEKNSKKLKIKDVERKARLLLESKNNKDKLPVCEESYFNLRVAFQSLKSCDSSQKQSYHKQKIALECEDSEVYKLAIYVFQHKDSFRPISYDYLEEIYLNRPLKAGQKVQEFKLKDIIEPLKVYADRVEEKGIHIYDEIVELIKNLPLYDCTWLLFHIISCRVFEKQHLGTLPRRRDKKGRNLLYEI